MLDLKLGMTITDLLPMTITDSLPMTITDSLPIKLGVDRRSDNLIIGYYY